MRIIAGAARRVELEVADGSSTRPFLEMARGALFNSLAARVAGAAVLDLYAGSGALGLEALSRGAETCRFVERGPAAFAALKKNIAKCGFADRAEAVRLDVRREAAAPGRVFDLIFVDPPFPDLPDWTASGGNADIMAGCARKLGQDGIIVFRYEEGKAEPPAWPGLRLDSDRRYGRSRICRYAHGAPATPEEDARPERGGNDVH